MPSQQPMQEQLKVAQQIASELRPRPEQLTPPEAGLDQGQLININEGESNASAEEDLPDPAFNDRVREARRDELIALENSGALVAGRNTSRDIGQRAIERAKEAPLDSHIPVRTSVRTDKPLLH